MQKLYWLFCVMNFTFPQSDYIWQLLTIGHNCPVLVDKYDCNKRFTPFPDPLGGVKSQIFKFCNNKVSCLYFLPKFRMQAEVQYI